MLKRTGNQICPHGVSSVTSGVDNRHTGSGSTRSTYFLCVFFVTCWTEIALPKKIHNWFIINLWKQGLCYFKNNSNFNTYKIKDLKQTKQTQFCLHAQDSPFTWISSNQYWAVCLIMCKSGLEHSPKNICTACVHVYPISNGLLPLWSRANRLAEPHQQRVETASPAFSTKSFTKDAFVWRVWMTIWVKATLIGWS